MASDLSRPAAGRGVTGEAVASPRQARAAPPVAGPGGPLGPGEPAGTGEPVSGKLAVSGKAAVSGKPAGPAKPAGPGEPAGESEPDARFTFANERTFLAWHRTALALIVAGLAIVQLLPPFPGVVFGRHLLAVPLIVLGGGLSVGSYLEWLRHQRALRRGQPLGTSMLPRILAVSITLLALTAGLLSLLASGSGR